MASLKTFLNSALLTCLFLISIASVSVLSYEFKIGGDGGWTVPPDNLTLTYNDWAGKNRFHIGDTLYFKYQNDSVLVVDRNGYDNCYTLTPIAQFEDGSTVFKFDRSGFFYFISGQVGHCKSGQKLIIDVMHPFEVEPPESAPAPQPGRNTDTGGKSDDDKGFDSDDLGPPRYNTAAKLGAASYSMVALGGVWMILNLFSQEFEEECRVFSLIS